MKPTAGFDWEKQLWEKGCKLVAGIDEVGRGAWAGPVVAAAVIFPPFFKPTYELFDSKLLSAKQREELSKKIRSKATIGIGLVEVPIINKIGIGKASQKAFRRAIGSLNITADHYLIDAFYIRYWSRENQTAIKKGDRLCASIAAASIVAKVFRDNLMKTLDGEYPGYNFSVNKGYGTKSHQESLKKLKFSKIHRTSFNLKPILSL